MLASGSAFILAVLMTMPALAHDYTAGGLTLRHPWSNATSTDAQVVGGYVVIINRGIRSDRLISGSSPLGQEVEILESRIVGDSTRVRPVAELAIPPGGMVTMKPGGPHLVFTKPNMRLREGERFTATLVFERAGPVVVEFLVHAMGANANEVPHTIHEIVP